MVIEKELRDKLAEKVLEHFIGKLSRTHSGAGYYLPNSKRDDLIWEIATIFEGTSILPVRYAWFMPQTNWSKLVFRAIMDRRMGQWMSAGSGATRLRNEDEKSDRPARQAAWF